MLDCWLNFSFPGLLVIGLLLGVVASILNATEGFCSFAHCYWLAKQSDHKDSLQEK